MDKSIGDFFRASLRQGLVPWTAEREAATRYGMDAHTVEGSILAEGLLPARYARNVGSLGLEGQKALHDAHVLVAGCGGLGGNLIEGLARLGVGYIVAVDPDCFDESNLNRQVLCTIETLGNPKADEAARRVSLINPASKVSPVRARIGPDNAAELLADVHIAMDGLDSVSARMALSEACAHAGIALVHAAVAGWYGQVSTQTGSTSAQADASSPSGSGAHAKAAGLATEASKPAGPKASVAELYALAAGATDRGDELRLGNQAYGPAFAAAIQLAEACKIICGKTPALGDRLFTYDLLAMTSASFELG